MKSRLTFREIVCSSAQGGDEYAQIHSLWALRYFGTEIWWWPEFEVFVGGLIAHHCSEHC